ncbi:hypothetical protein RND81_10G175000 [Saponaria officinalis]|uniref:Transcriptional coactivator Hfi1/Transcriptional adapter 1 n=1 Tax=Saponaria officinalis TaxID=3572 RepID=A0AAW1I4J2_SAPOF
MSFVGLRNKMQPEKNSRVDIGELKAQMFKKIGQERFKRYFHGLNRFINQKLSKSEFDKFCYRILGRENLPLHNQIIKGILKNACSAKTPPMPPHEAGPASKAGVSAQHQSSAVPVWSNGVVPISPRKGRSTVRDRKLKDRPRPLGPNGKVQTATDDIGLKTLENGDLIPCDYQRPLCHPRGLAEQPENDERPRIKKPADVVARVENGEDAVNASRMMFLRRSLVAPLGIPFCSASSGGAARKTLPVSAGDNVSCFDLGGLYDSEVLRRRMEQITTSEGVGVTLECANTLNNMVDVYLKRLIRSCLELVGSRSSSDMSTTTYPAQKQQMHGKPINGVWQSNQLHMQNSGGTVEAQRFNQSASLLDFKVAMELNPQQLGENWSSLLEKISMQGFEE